MVAETDLVDAICTAPELDEPRLAYARWLDERGDPRGEFIRASCTPGGEARAAELLALHGERWTSGIVCELAGELSHPPRFERGFIAELYVMGTVDELLLDYADAVCALRPVPVAVILAAERVLLRADQRAYAWQSRADNAIVIAGASLENFEDPEQREWELLVKAPPTSETVTMLGFVGDSLRYRVGRDVRELRFSLP